MIFSSGDDNEDGTYLESLLSVHTHLSTTYHPDLYEKLTSLDTQVVGGSRQCRVENQHQKHNSLGIQEGIVQEVSLSEQLDEPITHSPFPSTEKSVDNNDEKLIQALTPPIKKTVGINSIQEIVHRSNELLSDDNCDSKHSFDPIKKESSIGFQAVVKIDSSGVPCDPLTPSVALPASISQPGETTEWFTEGSENEMLPDASSSQSLPAQATLQVRVWVVQLTWVCCVG